MSFRGARLSEQHRERIGAGIRRYHERRRMAAEIAPRDLERLEKSGTIAPSLQPLLEIARIESAELIDALGGAEQMTPQQRILIEDAVAVGMTLRGTLAMYLQKNDPELGSRISGMATTRRGIMQALGLDRVEPRAIDLQTYLQQQGESKTSRDSDGEVHDVQGVDDDEHTRDETGRFRSTADGEVGKSDTDSNQNAAQAADAAPGEEGKQGDASLE